LNKCCQGFQLNLSDSSIGHTVKDHCQQFSTVLSGSGLYSRSASRMPKTSASVFHTLVGDCFYMKTSQQRGRRPLSSIFGAFVGEFSRNSNLSQTGWKPFSTVFDCSVGFCIYLHSPSRWSKTTVNSLRLLYRILLELALSVKRVEDPFNSF